MSKRYIVKISNDENQKFTNNLFYNNNNDVQVYIGSKNYSMNINEDVEKVINSKNGIKRSYDSILNKAQIEDDQKI